MRVARVIALVVALNGLASAQSTGTLRVRVTLLDAAGAPVPVARHALLVSDNPATSEPRRVFTATDGTVVLVLRPGSYTVESDRPYAFLGRAHQWTQMVDVAAGAAVTLDLGADNVEIVAATEAATAPGAPVSGRDATSLLVEWQDSVFGIWSPTAHASGFLVDERGLVATDRNALGTATAVEVQLSPTVKVPGRVLPATEGRDVALVRVDPTIVAGTSPLPLACPPAAAPPLDDGQEIVTLATGMRTPADVEWGEVTSLHARGIEADLRLPPGGAGGPVFNDAGAMVGLTSAPADPDSSRRRDVVVLRMIVLCEAVAAGRAALAEGAAPPPTRLPVEPQRPYPADALASLPKNGGGAPPVVSSADFDVAFITPPMIHAARQRADWTGGSTGRSPEAEARIGRLTEFGAWSDYFADLPPLLIVRVTPRLVEGFWKRLGREAARTQGAALPAFKDFKGDFLRMRASCGGAEVTPIHPFVLEHPLTEKDVVREGLYVFDPDALGPRCGTLTLALHGEKAPEKADTLTVDPKVLERVWQDFQAFRSAK